METILVADDDATSRTFLESLLKKEGFLVRSAADGDAALALAKTLVPDILVTDLEMPGLSGNQLITAARAVDRLAGLYAIVLTVRGEKADKMKSLLSGADDFMVKPASAPEILGRIEIARRILRMREEAKAAVRKAREPDVAALQGIAAALDEVRSLVADGERRLSSPDPAAAREALRRARTGLEKLIQEIRKPGPAA